MLTVAQHEVIRRKVLVDGLSQRTVAQELGRSRLCFSPVRIRRDQVYQPQQGEANLVVRSTSLDRKELPRRTTRLNKTVWRHLFVTSAVNANLAVRQHFGSQPRRVGRQHLFAGTAERPTVRTP